MKNIMKKKGGASAGAGQSRADDDTIKCDFLDENFMPSETDINTFLNEDPGNFVVKLPFGDKYECVRMDELRGRFSMPIDDPERPDWTKRPPHKTNHIIKCGMHALKEKRSYY